MEHHLKFWQSAWLVLQEFCFAQDMEGSQQHELTHSQTVNNSESIPAQVHKKIEIASHFTITDYCDIATNLSQMSI